MGDKPSALVLFEESGYTFEALTARVNQLQAAAGLARRPYHTSTIFRLITGASRQARDDDAPLLIAQALGWKLGRLVHPAELWPDLDFAVFDLGFDFPRDLGSSIPVVTALWAWSGMDRRAFAQAGFVAGALALPAFRWLSYPPDRLPTSEGGTVTAVDVDAMQSFAASFRQLDAKHGGGQVLPLMTAYLTHQVAPQLKHGRFATSQVARQVFAEAAVLTHMLAWLCHDAGRDGLAQRHYIQALRLAKAADDSALGIFCLAAASQHARHLGQLDDALDAALGAREGIGRVRDAPARLVAWVHAMEARAWAALGPSHRSDCHTAIKRCLDAFDQADDAEPDPAWIAYIDEASLAGEAGHCHADLDEPVQAMRHATRVLELRTGDRLRSKTFAQILLANTHLDQKRVETAATVTCDIVDQVAQLRSRSSTQRFHHLYARLMAHKTTHPTVRELDEKARALLRAG